MRRVMVTGGAGLIGSHLCDRLLVDGCEVLCVDNYSTGARCNIHHLISRADFETLRHDITFPLDAEVDAIYNLACPASPVHYQRDPVQTTKTAVHGAINMLELARRLSVPIFQASTSEVYGKPEEHPQPESYWGRVNPVGPRACYDEGKRCAETLFFDYHRQYGLAIRVARIFNTYGPRMAVGDGRVVPAFIVAALRGDPITIFGDGTQSRSFCHVSDLVDGIVAFMGSDRGLVGPLNLGNPEETTIHDLARLVVDLTGSKSRLVFHPLPEDDPIRRKPDIGLAREKLDWSPSVGLRAGMAETIRYFDARLSGGAVP